MVKSKKTSCRDAYLQSLCRGYLRKARKYVVRHNLSGVIDGLIRRNKSGECSATNKEVVMLSRLVDDERLCRTEVPELLCKSYRKCVDDGDFDKIDKLRRVGVYGKVSALLHKHGQETDKSV